VQNTCNRRFAARHCFCIRRAAYREISYVMNSSRKEIDMQTTPTRFVSAEAKGALLRTLTIATLVLLILEFILGEITNLFVQIPSTHPGTASSGSPGLLPGLGWSLTQSSLPFLQVHGALGLLLVLLSLVLIGLAIARRSWAWVISSLVGSVGLILAALGGVGFVNSGEATSSLVMALGFLLALIAYGMVLYLTRAGWVVQ
jgi:hypothetical protein